MKSFHFIFLMVLMVFCSCKEQEDFVNNANACEIYPLENHLDRKQLLQSYDLTLLQSLASMDLPNQEGALGRNKEGYFHVRFQMAITPLSDFAVTSQNVEALSYAIQAIEYTFNHQLSNGDFQLVIPSDLSNYHPTTVDKANAVSFFLSSLGIALNNFEQSPWYHSTAMEEFKNRIEILRPNIIKAAQWLESQKYILQNADANAPNRLLYDALAFYSLGKWLNEDHLKSIGLELVEMAISKKTPQGYFLEKNGWDSSYQGVALYVGFNLYSLIEDNLNIKTSLWNCLSCAADWQRSRILTIGEITTEGNTRVYPGGEHFLGNEKQVDWIKTMLAMYDMGYYSAEIEFEVAAENVLDFYLN